MSKQTLKGFSLIELLIVLFMISILSGGVAIAISATSSPEKRLFETGERLFAQMNFALDEALMQQHLIGLHVEVDAENGSTYSWHRYKNERWQALKEPLSSHHLTDEITLQISIEDSLLESLLEKSLNEVDSAQEITPAIMFYPSSEVSDFELTLALKENNQDKSQFRIFINERGELERTGEGTENN
ncbi:type II secretion system protein GspH [Candidatus Endobugula sertula]|uniref:Type II secretion system protein H n=1 Tax=Candidatus Endobugula sertula TaxID=62101 RepID=A0A1D2QSK9_9GAMM|nr:type II secretion system protein GspH [Candidatus Endobugula sertula]